MSVILAESPVVYYPPAWWQRALVADGQSWIVVGTLVISLLLVAALLLRYMYYLWWMYRVRTLREQGVVPSSALRVGQCAYLEPMNGKKSPRWRTMVLDLHSDTIEVDFPPHEKEASLLAPGSRVLLAANGVDGVYVMETEVLARHESSLLLRRQPLLRRLQRRQFVRVDLFAPLSFEVVGGHSLGNYTGTLLDIGVGGLCLQSPVALEIGTALHVTVPSLQEVLPVPLSARVVGVSQDVVDGRLEYRLHCAFVGMTAEQSERIARFVVDMQRRARSQQRWTLDRSVTVEESVVSYR